MQNINLSIVECAHCGSPFKSRRIAPRVPVCSPSLHRLYQRPNACDRASVAGSVQLGSDGRSAFRDSAALGCAQSGSGAAGSEGRGLALVEHPALIAGENNHVVKVAPALERAGDFAAFLGEEFDEALTYDALRKAESVGRPVGSREWLAEMEERTGLKLAPGKRGPASKKKRLTDLAAKLPHKDRRRGD